MKAFVVSMIVFPWSLKTRNMINIIFSRAAMKGMQPEHYSDETMATRNRREKAFILQNIQKVSAKNLKTGVFIF